MLPNLVGIDLMPASLPALYHAVALGRIPAPVTAEALEAVRTVVPAYRINAGLDVQREAEQAAHVVRHILDRMVRLRGAYAEWAHFDAPAYFDLTHAQCARLLEIGERVSAVHILFRADLLLPSVQAYVVYWAEMEPPPDGGASIEAYERFAQQVAPEFTRRWQRALAAIHETRRLLAGDVDYLAANAAEEERWRWRVDPALQRTSLFTAITPISPIPTLALTIDFPLPTWKQPGRKRRLMRNRARGRHRPARR